MVTWPLIFNASIFQNQPGVQKHIASVFWQEETLLDGCYFTSRTAVDALKLFTRIVLQMHSADSKAPDPFRGITCCYEVGSKSVRVSLCAYMCVRDSDLVRACVLSVAGACLNGAVMKA